MLRDQEQRTPPPGVPQSNHLGLYGFRPTYGGAGTNWDDSGYAPHTDRRSTPSRFPSEKLPLSQET